MTTEELLNEIEQDSKIDQAALDIEAIKVPQLHAKYYRLFMEEGKILRAQDARLKELRKIRAEYYLGKADDEVYKKEPLNFKVIKSDLDSYLDADKQLIDLQIKRDNQHAKVKMLEEFLKTINNRSFLISNAISWRKFLNGVA